MNNSEQNLLLAIEKLTKTIDVGLYDIKVELKIIADCLIELSKTSYVEDFDQD